MALFHIKHITQYTYNQPVTNSVNQVMLYPLQDEQQTVSSHRLEVSGKPAIEVFTDHFGNRLGIFTLMEPHVQLSIISYAEVETQACTPPVYNEPAIKQWEALTALANDYQYMDYLQQEDFSALTEVQAQVLATVAEQMAPLEAAQQLSAFVYNNFQYQKGITSVETSIDEVWRLRAGVCQDFAHILLVMLRMLYIPARYVSGYICPLNAELRGQGATHAWVEAYLPGYGWLGLDPTNNCIASDRHIRLAVGRSFSDCTPVKGTYRGTAAHTLEVSVIISSAQHQNESDMITPVFSYQVKAGTQATEPQSNLYRQFMEQQQQQ